MRRGRIALGEELVQPVSGGGTVSRARDFHANAPQTRCRHASERSGDCVAAMVQIVDALEHEIRARQVGDACVPVHGHSPIVRLSAYVYPALVNLIAR
jgi:hypothetical protein